MTRKIKTTKTTTTPTPAARPSDSTVDAMAVLLARLGEAGGEFHRAAMADKVNSAEWSFAGLLFFTMARELLRLPDADAMLRRSQDAMRHRLGLLMEVHRDA
jgi:hypothetical protein